MDDFDLEKLTYAVEELRTNLLEQHCAASIELQGLPIPIQWGALVALRLWKNEFPALDTTRLHLRCASPTVERRLPVWSAQFYNGRMSPTIEFNRAYWVSAQGNQTPKDFASDAYVTVRHELTHMATDVAHDWLRSHEHLVSALVISGRPEDRLPEFDSARQRKHLTRDESFRFADQSERLAYANETSVVDSREPELTAAIHDRLKTLFGPKLAKQADDVFGPRITDASYGHPVEFRLQHHVVSAFGGHRASTVLPNLGRNYVELESGQVLYGSASGYVDAHQSRASSAQVLIGNQRPYLSVAIRRGWPVVENRGRRLPFGMDPIVLALHVRAPHPGENLQSMPSAPVEFERLVLQAECTAYKLLRNETGKGLKVTNSGRTIGVAELAAKDLSDLIAGSQWHTGALIRTETGDTIRIDNTFNVFGNTGRQSWAVTGREDDFDTALIGYGKEMQLPSSWGVVTPVGHVSEVLLLSEPPLANKIGLSLKATKLDIRSDLSVQHFSLLSI